MLLGRIGFGEAVQPLADMVDGAKVDRAVDPDDLELRALRELLVADESAVRGIRIRYHDRDLRLRGAHQVDDQRQHHADVDGELELDEKGREERGRQHRGLALAGRDDGLDVVEVDQPVSHHQQHGRHGGDRQVRGQGRDQQHDQRQRYRGEDRR